MKSAICQDNNDDCESIRSMHESISTPISQATYNTSATDASYGDHNFIRRNEGPKDEYSLQKPKPSRPHLVFKKLESEQKFSLFNENEGASVATFQPNSPGHSQSASSAKKRLKEEKTHVLTSVVDIGSCYDTNDQRFNVRKTGIINNSCVNEVAVASALSITGDNYVGGEMMSFEGGTNSKITENETVGISENDEGGKVLSFKNDVIWNKKKKNSRTKRTTSDRSAKVHDFLYSSTCVEGDNVIYFVKQRYGYLSLSISAIQILIFATMSGTCGIAPLNINPMLGPYPDALSTWGAKNTWAILAMDEWWRMFSSSLIHVGAIHLFIVVAVQVETAAFFEREWGSSKWIVIYIASSVGATINACVMRPESISVVPSGALIGVFGAKFAEFLCRLCEKTATKQQQVMKQVRKEQIGGVVCSVSIISLLGFIPFVDSSAHVGGIITGFFVGMIFFSSLIQSLGVQVFCYTVGALAAFSSIVFPLIYLIKNITPPEELASLCDYYQRYFWDNYICSCSK